MKVKIKNLSFKCIIGILKQERVKKQKVIINCSYIYEFKENTNNELEKFIDYSKVAKDIEKTMKNKKFLLLETAILEISKKIEKKHKITKLKLEITKPNIIKNCQVSLSNN